MNPAMDYAAGQSAVFDAAQAVRAFGRLHGAPLAALIDESEWDQLLGWQPNAQQWSARHHAAQIAEIVDTASALLSQLAPDNPGHHQLGPAAKPDRDNTDIAMRLPRQAEHLARLLESWILRDTVAVGLAGGGVSLITLVEEVVRVGTDHLRAAQRIMDLAAHTLHQAA